ncbi:MAG: phage gp6-like head-tail connector protein [Methanobrevibacter sp.]|nr:phage gp6-like head-tail connector protein [Methanobrevibacter sp.]MBQ6627421.1 phage gp6-like head-tail connector protein [Methanobrevibacter sp.]
MWIDVDEVKQFTGIKSKHLKLSSEDDDKLDEILTKWISQSEDLIKSYTNNDFKNEVPDSVKNVCLRLTANMVALAIERRDTPRTIVTDWGTRVSSSKIFTEDLKEDLTPFVKETSYKSDKVSFYAITGDD